MNQIETDLRVFLNELQIEPQEVSDTLIKGKRIYSKNQEIIATYFFDFADNHIDFDLDAYLEANVSVDYYNDSPNSQWNYYLFFIRPISSIDDQNKISFEKNVNYARKFVLSFAELKEYFLYTKPEGITSEDDVVSQIKRTLENVNLEDIYLSTESYSKIVDRFLKNKPKKAQASRKSKSPKVIDQFKIDEITNLEMSPEYREYPKKRTYVLKQVNLISGVNGTGKTSFLEAIELMISGRSMRNNNVDEPDKCINADYNCDGIKRADVYEPANIDKYKSRGRYWYAQVEIKGKENDLYKSFNKYNFYDSDAAFNLAFPKDKGSIRHALSSIALGTEFNDIQERSRGCFDLFKSTRGKNRTTIKEENLKLTEAQNSLVSLLIVDNPTNYLDRFQIHAKDNRWLKTIPQNISDDDIFESNIETVQSYVIALRTLADEIKLRNKKAWADQLESISALLHLLETNNQGILILQKQIDEDTLSLKRSEHLLNELQKVESYFLDPSSFQLLDLSEKLRLAENDVKVFARLLNIFSQLKNIDLNSNEQYIAYKERLFSDNKLLLEEKTKIEFESTDLKSRLNKLSQITSEIKLMGQRFIELDKSAEACPLCNTNYSYSELSIRIAKAIDDTNDSEVLKRLGNELVTIEGKVRNSSMITEELKLLDEALALLHSTGLKPLTRLRELNIEFQQLDSKHQLKVKSYEQLIYLRDTLLANGFNVNDFLEAKHAFEALFPDIGFNETSIPAYLKYKHLLSEQIAATRASINLSTNNKQDSISKLLEHLREYDNNLTSENYDLVLASQKAKFESGLNYFSQIEQYLFFDVNDDLVEIDRRIRQLHDTWIEYKNVLIAADQATFAKQTIEGAKSKIKILEDENNRITEAMDVLSNIVNKHDEEDLSAFIHKNEAEINDIFHRIHSPQELTGLQLTPDNSTSVNTEIKLMKADSNKSISLSQISSGQRSALALSIFLCLNKKLTNGPNVLLFDDPITNIDDLNVLSFLDYLREIVINDNKQVLFATANNKLAGLFEKKFHFLGDDFQPLPFDRITQGDLLIEAT